LRVKVGGGNILGRYRRNRADGSEIQLRVYYDRTHRDDPSFVDDLHTLDADFQHRFGVGGRQQITWGVNDRITTNENRRKVIFNLEPPTSRDNLLGGFVQDELTIRNGLRITGGTKIEHNDFSGLEVQPGARIAWDVSAAHMLWGAVSRAVRVPTRLERDVAIDVTDPQGNPVVRLLGNAEFESERLLAYEVGYRSQPWRQLVIDVAAFHNQYSGLASLELESPFSDPDIGRTVIPIRNRNLTDGFSRGAELLATVSPRENWRLMATYSYIDISLDIHGQDQNRGRFLEDATPRHQFGVRSFLDMPASVQLDAQLRSLGTIRRLPVIATGEGIAGYTELDVRISWRGWRDVELSLVAQNLLHDRHPEFGAAATRSDAQRSAYGKIAWGF
jgi:iron complex outermembrane recepter protein